MAQTARPEAGDALLDLEQNHHQPRASLWSRFQVAVVFVIFVTFRAADRVFSKALQNELKNPAYNTVWQNLLWPLAVQILTMGLIAGYVLMQRMQGNSQYSWRFFLPNNPLASSSGAIPMVQLALFSLGDQLNAALQAPPTPFVAQPVQNTMTSMVIIWMAPIAFFWIKTKFKQVHFVGMSLVVMAALVQLAPQISNMDCSELALQSAKADCFKAYWSPLGDGRWVVISMEQMVLWYVLFLVSTVPSAASNVYKQKVLQGHDADVFYVTFWSGWFQVVWGWLCMPILWIPLPGQKVLSPGDTFAVIGDALSCIAGNVPHPGDETCAKSPAPWVWIIFYLGFNLTFNVAFMWLIKRMSAGWAQVANGLCLNLCMIFSSLHFIMGSSAEALTIYDWLAAFLVSISLWVYNLEPEVSAIPDAHGTDAKTKAAVGSQNN